MHDAVETRLDAYAASPWSAPALRLELELDAVCTEVIATARYHCSAEDAQPLVLNGVDLELLALEVDGRVLGEAEYTLGEGMLTLPPTFGKAFTLCCRNRVRPSANTSLQGLYASGGILCTQMEAEGFRQLCYWQDRPDVLTRFDVVLRADAARYPVLLSNGNLIREQQLEDGRLERHWQDPWPKPCYLFALVGGDLACLTEHFTTASGREVSLHAWTAHGEAERARFALGALKASMRWDEQHYGREYDLDVFHIVAIHDFNMGAMENKSLNIFNAAAVLADARSATDSDYARIEGIVAHEYFHNWSGNRVTCRDWFQLSLKEGLTVYRDQCFSGDMNDPVVQRIQDVRRLREFQFPEDAGPLSHPVRPASYAKIDNFYTATIYEKGAEVIRMQATRLGKAGFRRGAEHYFETQDGRAATLEDWVAALEHGSGESLADIWAWYTQAGTPVLSVSQSVTADGIALKLTQATASSEKQPAPTPLPIPIRLGFLSRQGEVLEAACTHPDWRDGLFLLREAEVTVNFTGLPKDAVPSVLRDFSAPVVLDFAQDDEALGVLARADVDGFKRWDALQQLASRALLESSQSAETALIDGLRAVLNGVLEGQVAPAWAAEALQLPTELELNEQLTRYEVERVHTQREQLATRLATTLLTEFEALRAWCAERIEGMEAEARGARALLNRCRGYGMRRDDPALRGELAQAVRAAATLTERLGALLALQLSDAPEREEALAEFASMYADEPLVMNKWFAVQASAPTMEAKGLRALAAHPAFDGANPNKVRALYGGFARNLPAFHRTDGSGYSLIAEEVRRVDALNPILASRLATLLVCAHKLPEAAAATLREAVAQQLPREAALSANLEEVLKSLRDPV